MHTREGFVNLNPLHMKISVGDPVRALKHDLYDDIEITDELVDCEVVALLKGLVSHI